MLKPASIAEIKAELQTLPADELLQLCLRLARFKQDNKELLTYLLFEATDTDNYTQQVQQAISEGLAQVNTNTVFFAKKTIRKILRQLNKVVRYSGHKEMEVTLRIHFLKEMKQLPAHILNATIIDKLLRSEQQKCRKTIRSLHEDLQHDLLRQLDEN